jgi:hypothetical protein
MSSERIAAGWRICFNFSTSSKLGSFSRKKQKQKLVSESLDTAKIIFLAENHIIMDVES